MHAIIVCISTITGTCFYITIQLSVIFIVLQGTKLLYIDSRWAENYLFIYLWYGHTKKNHEINRNFQISKLKGGLTTWTLFLDSKKKITHTKVTKNNKQINIQKK